MSALKRLSKVDHAQVNTQHILRVKRRVFRHVDSAQQIEDVIAQHQVGLSLDTPLSGLLVRTTDKRDMHPSTNGPQAGAVEPLKTQDPLIVADSAIGLEGGTYRLVALETLHGLRNRAYRHLRRQAKAFPDFVVGQMVDGHLPKDARRKAGRGGIGCRFVTARHGVTQGGILVWRGKQVEL